MSDEIGSRIQFTKMHGLGNDFVLVDARFIPNRSWADVAIKMCDRHFGVGADGLILVLASQVADLRMRIINSDGSEAQMCGNGIRCLARYVYERGIARRESTNSGRAMVIETLSGIKKVDLEVTGDVVTSVRVDMGAPAFASRTIPVAIDASEIRDYPLVIDGREFAISCVSMGNPHTVIFLEQEALNQLRLDEIGPAIERHPLFPDRTNVEFSTKLDTREGSALRVRVWERGAGHTLACGTGACAAAVSAIKHGLVNSSVQVVLDGGTLLVEWAGGDNPVYMSGGASYVCDGIYYYE